MDAPDETQVDVRTLKVKMLAADGERCESLLVCEDPGAGPLRVLVSDVAFRVCRQLATGSKSVRFMAFCAGRKKKARFLLSDKRVT